jgi:preprotein translocase subunit SecF
MGLASKLYRGETTFNFVGRRWWGFGLSIVLLALTVGSLAFRGLNLGIDFTGGVAWEVPSASVTVGEIEDVLSARGIDVSGAKVQELTGAGGRRIRVQVGDQSVEAVAAVRSDLATAAGVSSDSISVASVSSSWGRSITEKAVRALLVFFVLVSLFIAWRFEWKMALAAFASLVHDVAISVGVYSLTGVTVSPATVVAFLTILGYSLYDTIVVFDKVHDNAGRLAVASRVSYGDVVNLSMNQVLMRSLNTSISSILPVLSLLLLGSAAFGVESLRDFALALFVGLALGAYSSIFVAAPLLAIFKSREPRWAGDFANLRTGEQMSALAQVRRSGDGRRERSADAERSPDGARNATPPVQESSATVAAVLAHPPRPRKKKRRV